MGYCRLLITAATNSRQGCGKIVITNRYCAALICLLLFSTVKGQGSNATRFTDAVVGWTRRDTGSGDPRGQKDAVVLATEDRANRAAVDRS
jgi:hypothetical protein